MIFTQMKLLSSHGWMISLLILSQHLFKVSTLRPNTSTKTAEPLVNCIVNDGLVDAVPNVHQTLLEFINVVHPWLMHSLLDDAPYLVVNWIEVGTVWHLAATDLVEWKQVLLAREVAQCHVPGEQERCPVERWRNRLTHHASLATAAVTGTHHGSIGAVYLCSWINADQVCNVQPRHADRNHDRLAERRSRAQQTLSSNLLLLHKVV